MACISDRNTQNKYDYLGGYYCCRLCCDTNNLQELFPANNSDEELLRRILVCTSVKIERSSNEDAVICSECVSKINGFYKYRELCRTNDIKHQEWNRRLALAMGHTESTSIPLDDNEAFRFVETHDGTTSCMQDETCTEGQVVQEPEPGDGIDDRVSISSDDEEIDEDEEDNSEVQQQPQEGTVDQFYIAGDDEMYEPRAAVIDTRVMSAIKRSEQIIETLEKDCTSHHEYRLVTSKRGWKYLFRQGYLFSQHTINPTTIIANCEWYCINHHCGAKCQVIDMYQLPSPGSEHNHASPLARDAQTSSIIRYLSKNVTES
uniref:Uncharacterized protein n=1 Tax=Anopheles albimanus TaxID=7167 RepID=A0A182F0Y3_ANOAL